MLVTETFLQKQYQRANILVPVGHRFPWALECYVSVCPAHLCTKHWQEEATASALTGGPHSARVNLEELKRHDCKEGIMNISTPGLASSNQSSVNFPRYVVHGSEDAPQTENSHMCIFHEKRGGLGGSWVQNPGTEWLGTLNSVHMGSYIFFFSFTKHTSKDSECEQRLRPKASYRARNGGSWLHSQLLGGWCRRIKSFRLAWATQWGYLCLQNHGDTSFFLLFTIPNWWSSPPPLHLVCTKEIS
jgi:hypothetical protein